MEDTYFHRFVIQGGVMMIALIPCLFLMIAFAFQGVLNLRASKVAPKDFAQRLLSRRRSEGIKQARALLKDEDHSLAEILRSVMAHLDFNQEADPAEVLRTEIESECDVLLQQNSQLSVIYRITPLLGLLGTVFGMITTFNEFSQSNNPDVQELSVGINVALITTAWGLSIAIPAYIILYLLQRRIAEYEQVIFPREANLALHSLLDEGLSQSRIAAISGIDADEEVH